MPDKWPLTLRQWLAAIFAVLAVVILWQLLGHLPLWFYPDSLEDASRYGDSFGFVNSLFSALAFLGIIATILLQRQELQLQREELEQTREELKRSADAHEKSQAALREQVEWLSLAPYLQALMALRETGAETAKVANAQILAIVEIGKPRIAREAEELIVSRERQHATALTPLIINVVDKHLQTMRECWNKRDNKAASVNLAGSLLKEAVRDIERNTASLKGAILAYQFMGGLALDPVLHKMSSVSSIAALTPNWPTPKFGDYWRNFSECIDELEKAREEIASKPAERATPAATQSDT